MVSRKGDKAEACGAWQQSGQINNYLLCSQREQNGDGSRANPSVPVRVHKSVRETSRSTVSKCWHTGIQQDQHRYFMLCPLAEAPLSGHHFRRPCASRLNSTATCLRAGGLHSATFARKQWGKEEARQDLPFSSQNEGFLDMEETTAYLIIGQLPHFHTKGTDNVGNETSLDHLY